MRARSSSAKDFIIEALEPRVLLSGTDLVTPVVPSPTAQVQIEESQAVTPQNSQQAISYDPAAQVDNIFGGASGSGGGEENPTTPPPSQEQNQSPTEPTSPNSSPVVEPNANAAPGSTTDPSNVATEQSVETLTAANGPPIAAAPPVVGVVTAQAHQFQITFDYSQDTHNFFQDPIRRKLLEKAAYLWAQEIGDDFPELPAGTLLRIQDPTSVAHSFTTIGSPIAIDDLVIFVGSAAFQGADANNPAASSSALDTDPSQATRLAKADFEPFAGSISFNSGIQFYFDQTPLDIADDLTALRNSNRIDFLTTAVREIGRILGISPIVDSFKQKLNPVLPGNAVQNFQTTFTGTQATAANNGNAVPMSITTPGTASVRGNGTGVVEGSQNVSSVMVPSINRGVRMLPQTLDFAMLYDLGYQPWAGIRGAFQGAISLTTGAVVNASRLPGNDTETAITVDVLNPGTAVITANIGTGPTQFIARTTTAAAAAAGWVQNNITNAMDGTAPVANSRFDGALAADRFGNIHLVYMTSDAAGNLTIKYTFSVDGGATFPNANFQTLDGGGPRTVDKPWVTTGPDANSPGNEVVIVTYKAQNGRLVMRGASVTGLNTIGAMSAAVRFSDNTANNNYAVPSVGPQGQVLVTWQNPPNGQGAVTIFVARDLDGLRNGLAFANNVTVTTSNGGGFDSIPATTDRNTFASPEIAYDRSGGPFSGRVYLLYADEIPDESDNFDIFIRFSDDDGAHWSNRIRVNDDAGGRNSQFFQNISVDQATGAIFVSWYDARNDRFNGTPGDTDNDNLRNSEVQYFGSVSLDGGRTWAPNVAISAIPARPPAAANAGVSDENGADFATGVADQNDFGDYTGIAAFGGAAYAVWPDNSNSTGDIPAQPAATAVITNAFDVYTNRVVLRSAGGLTVTAAGTAGDDTFYIRKDASGKYVQFYYFTGNSPNPSFNGKVPAYTAAIEALTQINIVGRGGNDTLVLDASNGPISGRGISFDGGAGINNIVVKTGGQVVRIFRTVFGNNHSSGLNVLKIVNSTQLVDFKSVANVIGPPPAGAPQLLADEEPDITMDLLRKGLELTDSAFGTFESVFAQALAGFGDSFASSPISVSATLSDGLLENPQIFARMVEDGTGAFHLSDLGETVTTVEQLRALLDGLDSTANNVTVTQAGQNTPDLDDDQIEFNIQINKTLKWNGRLRSAIQ